MSDLPTDQPIDVLQRSVRRWKGLALTAMAASLLAVLLSSGAAGFLLRRTELQTEAARQAEIEARQEAELSSLEAAAAHRWAEQLEGRAARQLAEGVAALDTSLRLLLKESAKNDTDHNSRFFKTLSALAQKHGSSFEDYVGERFFHDVDEGYAVYIREGEKSYVVAILRGDDHIIPGSDTQYLLLLDHEGRLLDRLSCAINNRLTRMFVDYSGVFRTEVPDATVDGAQLIIRYIPEDGGSVSGNWSHGITHRGKTYPSVWNQDFRGSIPSAELDKKGLCRVAVRNGKLAVVFPKLERGVAEY